MTDQELADRIYALVGLCGFDALEAGNNYEYVRDPRVAMALIKLVFDRQFSFMIMQMPDSKPMMTIHQPLNTENDQKNWAAQVVDESLPRAITEACVEALT